MFKFPRLCEIPQFVGKSSSTLGNLICVPPKNLRRRLRGWLFGTRWSWCSCLAEATLLASWFPYMSWIIIIIAVGPLKYTTGWKEIKAGCLFALYIYIDGYRWVPWSQNRIATNCNTIRNQRRRQAGPHSISASGLSVPPSRTSTKAGAADGFSETGMSWPVTWELDEGDGT